MTPNFLFISLSVLVFTGIALFTDLRSRRLPNWLTLGGLVAALIAHGYLEGWAGLWLATKGFAVGGGIMMVLWLVGGGGGGDVKFMAALGAWLGAALTLVVFLSSTVVAILCLIGVFSARGLGLLPKRKKHVVTNGQEISSMTARTPMLIPYALPVAIACWCVLGVKLWAWKTSQGL